MRLNEFEYLPIHFGLQDQKEERARMQMMRDGARVSFFPHH